MTIAGGGSVAFYLALPLTLLLSSSSSSSASFSDTIVRMRSCTRLESSRRSLRSLKMWTCTRVAPTLAGAAVPAGSSGTASTLPSTTSQRFTNSSLTAAVAIASRSAAFGVNTTRLTSDPWIGSTLAGLSDLTASAASKVPPLKADAAKAVVISLKSLHRSSRMLLTPNSFRHLRFWLRAGEAEVECGKHEETHDCRSHHTTEDGDRHRMQDLETCDVAQNHKRQQGKGDRRRARQDRSQSLAGATQDESRAKGLALLPLQALVAVDQQNAVAHREGEYRKSTGKSPEQHGAAGQKCRQHAAGERYNQACENQERQSPALQTGLQE